MVRKANSNINYQQVAKDFAIGDKVVPLNSHGIPENIAGRVIAIWPGIGMVDVQFSNGEHRYPVEEVQRLREDTAPNPPTTENSVPGGGSTTPVSGGPEIEKDKSRRVAEAFVKKSLYWAEANRHYRASSQECESGEYACPKCGDKSTLRKAVYKRRDGQSEHLLGCPSCLFLIKRADIIGDPAFVEVP